MSALTLCRTGESPASADGRQMYTLYYDVCLGRTVIGRCELRPEPTWAAEYFGQVSYTIFPAWRGHHYAADALALLCAEAGRRGADTLRVTCRPGNLASRRTLERAGAALVGTFSVPSEHPLTVSGIGEVCIYRLQTNSSPADGDRNQAGMKQNHG